MSEKAITFQEIIIRLEKFWAEQGCLIWQPYNHQVGAGTMNPATVLRVLGPEPWSVAYVEPSVRPDDGRYGENPNRLNQHYQYQVILQPDPGNPQELYLQSLEAVGINRREHDIRFVEDNWESPALGAWGLGWEVWLDGQEITQFTYFQQAGGQALESPAVEITYGLERIAIALQGVNNFRDIKWTDTFTYGDVNLQSEQEHSAYNFEIADVDRMRNVFDIAEAEALAALERGLVLPAHDNVLKCSHTFNVLDTRGAVGVTERANYFRRMRNLSRKVSEAYVAQREELGFPWMDKTPATVEPVVPALPAAQADAQAYLLEIGVEELPASNVDDALAQLQTLVPTMFAENRLTHGEIEYFATPRRLAILVHELAARQPDAIEESRGPSWDRAFDENGEPTRAVQGFARGKGVDVADLEKRAVKGNDYVFAIVKKPGLGAPEVLATLAPALIAALKFKRTMRWVGGNNTAFSRPIRWLVSLLGGDVVPFAYATLVAGRESKGIRPLSSPAFEIATATDYAAALTANHIMGNLAERRAYSHAEAVKLAAEVGGVIPDDEGLLAEVANLIEAPTAFRGTFEEDFLSLPQEVLIAVMRKHQRYFPVLKDGEIQPYFIGVRNGDAEHLDKVIYGNEQVIRARFADANYFVREDVTKALADFRPELSKLTFQEKLGSMLDKSDRTVELSKALGAALELTAAEQATAERAAWLAKADLATQMVVEMTSLQGVIGRDYALRSGEPADVAAAIEQHYWPAGSGDAVAETMPAVVVGLADRLDSLVGLFAAGLEPTGNADPFGLRRAALGIVQTLIGKQLNLDLIEAVEATAGLQPMDVSSDVQQSVINFIAGRLRVVLRDAGYAHDVVEAVLVESANDPFKAAVSASQLGDHVLMPTWEALLDSYARCVRITRKEEQQHRLDPTGFTDPNTQALYAAYTDASIKLMDPSVDTFVAAFSNVTPAITTFFDSVMVMDKDDAVRHNNLALLQHIADLATGVADLSKLEGF